MAVKKLPHNQNTIFRLPSVVQFYLLIAKLFLLGCFGYLEETVKFLTPRRYRNQKDIRGQTVLITGAGSGIGRQLAIEFSRYSTTLVLLDINKRSLRGTQKLLDSSSKSFVYECDVSVRENIYAMSRMVKRDVGKVDILVNNAGIVTGKFFMQLPDDKIKHTMEVNMMAHFWTCKAFLPDMMSENKGHIISLASLAGLVGFPGLADYCASKFGAVGLMESLLLELKSRGLDGVKVTVVCPAVVTTGLFAGSVPPFSVTMSPEHVAREVLAGVKEEKERIILPRFLHALLVMKWIMPERVVHAFEKQSGVFQWMDNFTGRTTTNNNTSKTITRN